MNEISIKDLIEAAKEDVGEINIIKKGEGVEKLWHHIVTLFVFVVGIFSPNFKNRFYRDFATTVGNTIYIPNAETLTNNVGLIAHEIRHVYQSSSTKLFYLRYVLSRRWRLAYELDALTQTFYYHLKYNNISKAALVRHYGDSLREMYFLGRLQVNKHLERLVSSVETKIKNNEHISIDFKFDWIYEDRPKFRKY